MISPALPAAWLPKRKEPRPPLVETGVYDMVGAGPGIVDTLTDEDREARRAEGIFTDDEPMVLDELYKPKAPVLTKPCLTDRFIVSEGYCPIINGKVCHKGEVHSGAWSDLNGQLAGLVKSGALVRTDDEVNVREHFPAPKTDADPVPALGEENTRLSAEVLKLSADNKTLMARFDEILARDEGRVKAIADASDRIATLEKALAEARAEAAKPKPKIHKPEIPARE